PRDEGVLGAAEGALGASGRARKLAGRREAGDVDVARRRRDREAERLVDAWAAEVCGLVARAQVRVQPRDEGALGAADCALGAAGRAREVGGLREPGNKHVARGEPNRDGKIAPAASEERGLVERGAHSASTHHVVSRPEGRDDPRIVGLRDWLVEALNDAG